MANKKLTLFDYTDYRVFLDEFIALWKKDNRRWSYAQFSRDIGFSTPNYLKMILLGKRNLSENVTMKICSYFGFNKQEIRYFNALVEFNQAKDSESREKAFRNLQKCQKQSSKKADADTVHRFYSEWYNPVIRELVLTKDFDASGDVISRRLVPKVSSSNVKKALSFLEESGHLKRDENDRFVQAEPLSSTGKEVLSLSVANYHREMIRLAAESIERFPESQRNISSLTMAVSKDTYQKIVDEIYIFQEKIINLATTDTAPEDVCQLNFQLFPTTQRTEK